MKLEIIDLHVEVEGKEVLKGVSLTFEKGKTYAIMGPNGSGKSSLANALSGHPDYRITKGKIVVDGKVITNESADIRAQAGVFLSFQYPQEIPGVTMTNFLRTAYNNIHEEKLNPVKFFKLLKKTMEDLKMDGSFRKRYLNTGFSGGEKKRSEILQLALLKPKYAILDEVDSGLDVDALKVVCEMINKVREGNEMSTILITHYNRILSYIHPDEVYILYQGNIVKKGGKELAAQIEENGFEGLI